ncbi:MAG: SIMPL domain-containing protein [Solirubrobacteraceae bacterium]
MKRITLVLLAVVGGLLITGLVGGAGAQVPVIDSVTKSITVRGEGYGGPVPARSTVAARRSRYKAALEDAMDDAREKAGAIASKAGLTLGDVNEVTEEGSAATCGSPRTKTTCSMRATVTVGYGAS